MLRLALLSSFVVLALAGDVSKEIPVPCKGESHLWCHNVGDCEGTKLHNLCPFGQHFKCCEPKADAPHLRINLLKARVINVDGNVGLTPYDPDTDDFDDWSVVEGATDPEVVLKVGAASNVFAGFQEVDSGWKSNTLTPTFMELFTFGPQPSEAELYWAIYDKNLNPLDGLNGLGKRKLIAEGRTPLGQFKGTNAVHTFTDPSTNQTITIRIHWSAEVTTPCPEGAIHPRMGMLFQKDENRCVCDVKYQFLGSSGQCEPYPEWVKTCANFGRRACEARNKFGRSRCVDSSWSKLKGRCGDGANDNCELFKCRKQK